MSKIENRSSHDGWFRALKDCQFLILAAVLLIGIFIVTLKSSANDLKNSQLLHFELLLIEQDRDLKQVEAVMEVQQIIIKRQQLLIEQMNTILNKLVPPEPIDPDKWTNYE